MGDEVLMKKLMIIPLLAVSLSANSVNADKEALILEYKDMFEKISQKRIGVDESKIDNLNAPFLKIEKEVKKEESKKFVEPFLLQAIFGNKVKISGKWYKLNDTVSGMRIIAIKPNYVWLKNDEARKKLIMGSKNEKISIK